MKYKNKEKEVFLYFLDFDHSQQAERGSVSETIPNNTT